MIGTFLSEIVCEISGDSCVGEFTVVKGPGRPLLGKNTADKLGVLRVGRDVCSLTTEGSDADIREKYREFFTGVGKLKDFQQKLHIKDDVTPVAQPVRRLPFCLRTKVDEKLDELTGSLMHFIFQFLRVHFPLFIVIFLCACVCKW